MQEEEDHELTSSQGHNKITVIYRVTINENDLKTSRKDLPQLKKENEKASLKYKRGRDAMWRGPITLAW